VRPVTLIKLVEKMPMDQLSTKLFNLAKLDSVAIRLEFIYIVIDFLLAQSILYMLFIVVYDDVKSINKYNYRI